jgi:hypothetical protein
LPGDLWIDLPLLENLDLGWNDFRKLDANSFRGMSSKLERLNLRNNEALREIVPGTFDGISELRYLNLSTLLWREGIKLLTRFSGFFVNNREIIYLKNSNDAEVDVERKPRNVENNEKKENNEEEMLRRRNELEKSEIPVEQKSKKLSERNLDLDQNCATTSF